MIYIKTISVSNFTFSLFLFFFVSFLFFFFFLKMLLFQFKVSRRMKLDVIHFARKEVKICHFQSGFSLYVNKDYRGEIEY